MIVLFLRVDNVNDEYPAFLPTSTYYASVAKDAQANTPVLQLQAIDPDYDRVMFSFEDADGRKSQFTSLFYIDPDTGLIRLNPALDANDLSRANSPQQLTVIAFDDGSCCTDDSRFLKHVTRATVHIVLKHVNDHAPQFLDCASYSERAALMEGIYDSNNSPVIIKVHAFDNDSGRFVI